MVVVTLSVNRPTGVRRMTCYMHSYYSYLNTMYSWKEKKNSAGLYALIYNGCLLISMFGGLKDLMHKKKHLISCEIRWVGRKIQPVSLHLGSFMDGWFMLFIWAKWNASVHHRFNIEQLFYILAVWPRDFTSANFPRFYVTFSCCNEMTARY